MSRGPGVTCISLSSTTASSSIRFVPARWGPTSTARRRRSPRSRSSTTAVPFRSTARTARSTSSRKSTILPPADRASLGRARGHAGGGSLAPRGTARAGTPWATAVDYTRTIPDGGATAAPTHSGRARTIPGSRAATESTSRTPAETRPPGRSLPRRGRSLRCLRQPLDRQRLARPGERVVAVSASATVTHLAPREWEVLELWPGMLERRHRDTALSQRQDRRVVRPPHLRHAFGSSGRWIQPSCLRRAQLPGHGGRRIVTTSAWSIQVIRHRSPSEGRRFDPCRRSPVSRIEHRNAGRPRALRC